MSETSTPSFQRALWRTLLVFGALVAAFVFYVLAEKEIDRTNQLRQRSSLLADELRQTSDDLTRMVRTYAATGDAVYKERYQEILEIREGRSPRPRDAANIYWDLVLADGKRPRPFAEAKPLLELMREAGFTDMEFDKLAEAKRNSDALTQTEYEAMALLAGAGAPSAELRARAVALLHDEAYHRAKAGIMRPIAQFNELVRERTDRAVAQAVGNAGLMRWLFVSLGLLLAWMIWRLYKLQQQTLGAPLDHVHEQIARLGRGEFEAELPAGEREDGTVMGWLAELQGRLQQTDAERRAAEQSLRVNSEQLKEAQKIARLGSWSLEPGTGKLWWSEETFQLFELDPSEFGATYRDFLERVHPEDRESVKQAYLDSLNKGQPYHVVHRILLPDGRIKWIEERASSEFGSQALRTVGTAQDITELKQAEARIQMLAFYDQLTGLPNRTLLMDRLHQLQAASARNRQHGALLFIDLDHFKTINDTEGHEVGDQWLKEVAARLQACLRDGDTVARFGGDEFVVLLAGLQPSRDDAASDAEAVAEKLLVAIKAPFALAGDAYEGSASIGMTLFRGDQGSTDELMKQADLAMYKAKSAGRDAVCFFDPALEIAVKDRLALEQDLRLALAGQQFQLHYQPVVDSAGRTIGAECLLRWAHLQRGVVPPVVFIPLAEASGLILPLGLWVLETACATLARWATMPGFETLTLAVNVSARQFQQADFVTQVLGVLQRTAIDPERLKLELTESLLAHNVEDLIAKMVALKARGIGFSLDDFGTGYSSLSYLKRLPLDDLKVDASFVRDVLHDPSDAAIARTIVTLARSLDLGVIAEGVETEPQRAFMAGIGCPQFQGWLYSRPLPLAQFEARVLQGR
ncbi:GGDEF domain-containing phosphodiesterase [Pelomonas sp. SE-A7]|uniref:putative bifunctional diguanylate cyclase/phosphodiesterase n=1 Tax=Pelomonas sp. SE-A7 TaxID=3054953 RepID=UPI00259D07D3|nr:GGDEF domain-containing phosphodiesterase [Pelomonas sp. SE-A7]MDM4768022.1 EAL domain-containing protein [Pelomonas sp. SE-A7]